MPRHLLAILDELTANLTELKAALAPLTLLGGALVAEAQKSASRPRGARGMAPRGKGRISAKRRAGMQQQGRYMAAVRPLTQAQKAQVKRLRSENGVKAAIALARKLAR